MDNIEIKNLNFSFDSTNGHVDVFSGLNATFDKGKITCIVGHSGCGKTTLLRLLIGLEKDNSGSISIPQDINLGMVFQEDRLMPWLNLYENITLGLKNIDENKVHKLINFMGLDNFKKSFPYELSGGMKQRVALARALIRNSNMLLMDEPFSALDAFTRKKMQNEIISIKNELKVGMIFVTHSIEEALYISDEIIVIKDKKAISTKEDKDLWKEIKSVL